MRKIKILVDLLLNILSITFLRQVFDLFVEFIIENVKQIRRMDIGTNSNISSSARFFNGKNIIIGNYTNINRGCMLWAGEKAKIIIGNNCLTGPGVKIIASQYHVQGAKLIRSYRQTEKDIIIGNDVWLGANVVILPGVKIGSGAIIGAGSVVNKSIEEFDIVAGVPAVKIKSRK